MPTADIFLFGFLLNEEQLAACIFLEQIVPVQDTV